MNYGTINELIVIILVCNTDGSKTNRCDLKTFHSYYDAEIQMYCHCPDSLIE